MDQESNIIATTIVSNALKGRAFPESRPETRWEDDLDTIKVVTKETSYREIGPPSTSPLTLYVDNFPKIEGAKEYVGFEIPCASMVCQRYNLLHNRTVGLYRLLDALAESFPEHVNDFEIARRLIREHSLNTVEMS